MTSRFLLPLLLLGAAMPAVAQNGAPLPPPAAPPATAVPAPAPAPVVVSGHWTKRDATDLLAFVQGIGAEGLDPADYGPDALTQAMAGDPATLDTVATDTFVKVASDLALGHVRGDGRVDWHVKDDPFAPSDQQALLDRALSGHIVPDSLRSLLPTHPQYAALKAVLATTTDKALADKIRINLDRWRWLPRDLGHKYVIVNVPAYTVALVEGGQTLNRRRAVAGALKTPTPQLNALITGAIFNPWWEVPTSISHEVKGKKGYVAVPNGDGVRYRQPPGPRNALGRMKLVMGNPYAIYLHDTNAKNLFNAQARAYSHGCIRTEDAVGFAETLLQGTDWDHEKIYGTIASGKSVQANLATPVPVYIVYFTIASTPDSPGYFSYKDMYGRDKPALAALENLPIPQAPEAEESTTASAKPGKAHVASARPAAVKAAKPAGASASRQAALAAAVSHPSTR
ncbi:MAG TPA: L,D-transpeptidase family protein [Allosphingosinicella sp.]|jgi:murein L,D-transpeptidase YcbB/YkuD|nr:L,D-transpeptidase family protein [Allosphingosinicella sp.]